MSTTLHRRAVVVGLTLWVVAFDGPALAQDSRQTDVTVGYLRASCMNGVNMQVGSERTRRLALVGEFKAAFGPDWSQPEPRYRDFGILGGGRMSWYPGPRTTVFVQGLVGGLHSTAGVYSWESRSNTFGVAQHEEPELTIDYLALQPGGGVTMMLTPRLGVRAQVDAQIAIPDQSAWEGLSVFPRVTVGSVVRLGSSFTPRPPPPSRPRRPQSQVGDGAPRAERWDVAASVGLFANPKARMDATTAYRFYVGHYLRPHLKVDARVTLPVRGGGWDYETYPVAGLPEGGHLFTDFTVNLNSSGFGVTYQFRENTFFHPYLSTGVQVDRQRVHRFRDQRVQIDYVGPYPSTVVRYTVPALDERSTRVRARPYAGGGAKFYFNRWLFTRTELIWGESRMYDAAIGVDF